MKKNIALAVLGVILFFSLHIIYLVNFYALPKTTLWVNNCLDKKERIALSLTSPKIIFTSGSNTLFGLRAKDVENNLSIPSVNMAVHAGLEPDYILYRAKKVLKSGDTIVLLFEYEDLLWDGSYDETRVGEILTYDKNYRDTLSLEDRYDLYKNLTFFDILKSIKDQIRKSEEEPVGTAYNSTTLNSRGDETYNFNQKIIQNNMKKAYQPFEIKKLDTRGLKEILKFKKWCDEKNIKVFVSWPSIVYVKEYDSVKYQQFFNDLVEYFRMHNIQILGQPRDFILPQSLFYDTEYHLNSTGMTIRTQKVIKLLQEQGYGAPPTQSMSPR